jgi:hypothetical protein
MLKRGRLTRSVSLPLALALSTFCGSCMSNEKEASGTPADEMTAEEHASAVNERDALLSLGYLAHREVQDAEKEREGVTVLSAEASPGLNLYADPVKGEAHLLNLKGERLHSWASQEAQPEGGEPYLSAFNFGWQHVEPASDGSLFAIISRHALLKLSWDSRIEWVANLPAHHDIAISSSGEIITLTANPRLVQPLDRPARVILDDYITFISSDGQVENRLSIYDLIADHEELGEILMNEFDNRFKRLEKIGLRKLIKSHDQEESWESEAIASANDLLESGESPLSLRSQNTLLRRVPQSPSDLLHTNTVEILARGAAGLWDPGDLLISVRNLNLIAVVSEDPPKLKWWWGPGQLSGQHQPTLLENGNLLIFDNRIKRKRSRLVELDPVARKIEWRSNTSFFTRVEGGSEALENGNILVTESFRGRAFELGQDEEIVWEYWNPLVAQEDGTVLRRTIYRMSRVGCEFFEQSRGLGSPVRCSR